MASDPRALWLGANPGSLAEMTLYESSFFGGPTAPCNAPLASNGVTSIDHTFNGLPMVNNANKTSDVKVTGVAQADVTGVSVQIGDAAAGTTSIVGGTLSGGASSQTWTATIPAADVAGLADGTLTAAATFTNAAGPFGGTPMSIRKDTSAPGMPSATPGAGTYASSQAVSLTDPDSSASIHYTLDGSAPSEFTTTATSQVLITSSLTLRAVAIDPAGNASAIKDLAFVITGPPPPPPPPPVITPAGGGTITGAGSTGTTATTAGGAGGAGATASSTAGAGTTAGATARPALALQQLALAPRIKQSKAQRNGLRLLMRLPDGTEVVKVNIYRKTSKGLKLLSSGLKAPSAAGLYRVAQNHAALRRLLTKGSYEVQVTPGYSKSELGKTAKAAFKVV
jgi:hypothetical protein